MTRPSATLRYRFQGRLQRGFSMVELVIAMAIVAVLFAAGFSSYQRYVARANRAAVKTFLNDVAQRQESYFADRKHYATTLGALGYITVMPDPSNPNKQVPSGVAPLASAYIDASGNLYPSAIDKTTLYNVGLVINPANVGLSGSRSCTNMSLSTAPTPAAYANGWAAMAVAMASTDANPSYQEKNDAGCATLCLNSTGRQGSTYSTYKGNTKDDGWQSCWRG